MSKTSYNFANVGWWRKPFPDGASPKWSDATVSLITIPQRGPRESEGLFKRDAVEKDASLYVIASRFSDVDPFIRQVTEAIFKKGNQYSTNGGDAVTPFGWASDVDDMAGWPVYASTSTPRPETVYYVPVNQGTFNYGAFRMALDPNATAAHQATPEEVATETTMEPPDLTTGYSGASTGTDQAFEFTVYGRNKIFVAINPQESASGDSPHPQASVINKGAWKKYMGTAKYDAEALGLTTFVQRGWRGIGERPILAWQGGLVVSSAGQELGSAMEAVEKNGDRKAQDALGRVGITYHPSPIQRAEDFLGW